MSPVPEIAPACNVSEPSTCESAAIDNDPPETARDELASTNSEPIVCAPEDRVTAQPGPIHTSSVEFGSLSRSQFVVVCQSPVPAELSKWIVPGQPAAEGEFGTPSTATSTASAFDAIGPTMLSIPASRVEPAIRTERSWAKAIPPARPMPARWETTSRDATSSGAHRDTRTRPSDSSASQAVPVGSNAIATAAAEVVPTSGAFWTARVEPSGFHSASSGRRSSPGPRSGDLSQPATQTRPCPSIARAVAPPS